MNENGCERTNAAAFGCGIAVTESRRSSGSDVLPLDERKISCSRTNERSILCVETPLRNTSSVRPGGFLFGWMIEKWLLTSERTNERSILFVETLLRNHVVRPFVRPSGMFLFRWTNDKMFMNERSILLGETTLRNEVVLSGRLSLPMDE
jgi:hypothetical protein